MRNIGLPLFYYPSKWVYIDDDKNLLRALGAVLSEINFTETFQSTSQCLDFINKYKKPSDNYSFLNRVISDENYGSLNHTPTDFDVTNLSKLSKDKNRHDEIVKPPKSPQPKSRKLVSYLVSKLPRSKLTKTLMWPFPIIMFKPIIGNSLCLSNTVKPMLI